jgi:basic amino acid/polyamine antiporter, APA family
VSSDALTASRPAAGRLARRLGIGDAVVIGLGSMIGAGLLFGSPSSAVAP